MYLIVEENVFIYDQEISILENFWSENKFKKRFLFYCEHIKMERGLTFNYSLGIVGK